MALGICSSPREPNRSMYCEGIAQKVRTVDDGEGNGGADGGVPADVEEGLRVEGERPGKGAGGGFSRGYRW